MSLKLKNPSREREFFTATGKRWRAIRWQGVLDNPQRLDTILGRIATLEHHEVRGDGAIEYHTANGSGAYLLRVGDWLLSNGGYTFTVSDDVAQEILFDAPKHLLVQTIDHEVDLFGHLMTVTVDEQGTILEVRSPDGVILPEPFLAFVSEQINEVAVFPDFHEEVERRRVSDELAAYEYDDREAM